METKRGTKIIQIILLDLIFFLPLIYYYYKKKSVKQSLAEIGIKKIDKTELIKKSVFLIGALIAISLLVSISSSFLGANDLEKVAETIEKISVKTPLILFYFLTIRVISEEIFFRGFLVKKIGVFFSSVIFALAHFAYGSIIEIFGAFIAGLFLAYYYKKNNNLIPNIIGHIAYNAVILVIL